MCKHLYETETDYRHCDNCGGYHKHDYHGDCRDNAHRYTVAELENILGNDSWYLDCDSGIVYVDAERPTIRAIGNAQSRSRTNDGGLVWIMMERAYDHSIFYYASYCVVPVGSRMFFRR